ncbi:23S rRNA (adenine(2030)-N(6))-methyltransferase RlmJ [Ruegeria marina]|uniref:Ribosomal RNA large subunit methyltransferase J n=1 Tax=Ruegeria marina TaxID=639004 RepID=A0A1G6M1G8_9RHOB|nr:23S rRNA (adenine(2030)-N(6))-methyltransferase RlmJ [Ruegeria marina]SDC48825.1 23S rRNA (adenine2030-N6)-methyltransferase [Ruegeria marina]
MLSYQHIYHAGNLADVQKHSVLAVALEYLTRKDKPICYIETHAGRGLYRLDAAEAVKTGEAAAGIGRAQTENWFRPDHPLIGVLDRVHDQEGAMAYPGSPLIAAHLLRPGDTMHLAELHPQERAALAVAMASFPARIHARDGFDMAQSLLPPDPRRGMMLIDPSYEVKADYDRIPGIIGQFHRKWNVGVIALWYPILTDGRHKAMLAGLERLDLPGVLRHEVRFPPVRQGHRMVGSGMFVVNAPYGLDRETARLSEQFAGL